MLMSRHVYLTSGRVRSGVLRLLRRRRLRLASLGDGLRGALRREGDHVPPPARHVVALSRPPAHAAVRAQRLAVDHEELQRRATGQVLAPALLLLNEARRYRAVRLDTRPRRVHVRRRPRADRDRVACTRWRTCTPSTTCSTDLDEPDRRARAHPARAPAQRRRDPRTVRQAVRAGAARSRLRRGAAQGRRRVRARHGVRPPSRAPRAVRVVLRDRREDARPRDPRLRDRQGAGADRAASRSRCRATSTTSSTGSRRSAIPTRRRWCASRRPARSSSSRATCCASTRGLAQLPQRARGRPLRPVAVREHRAARRGGPRPTSPSSRTCRSSTNCSTPATSSSARRSASATTGSACSARAARSTRATYAADPTLRQLIDVVPFGLPSHRPRHDHQVLKGVHPNVADDDLVVLWGGGVWDWFDPLSVVEAFAIVVERVPERQALLPRPRNSRAPTCRR